MENAQHIRNVAFVGPNHSGKTSLVEAILHLTGAIPRRGKISEGTTCCDYEPEAIQRLMSTTTSFAHTTYKDTLINIVDCPGFVDFQEEAKLALLGVDVAVFVVEPDPAKLIQIDNLLRYTEHMGIARLIFVNKLDKHDLSISETIDMLKNMAANKTAHPISQLHYPLQDEHGVYGYVDVLKSEAFRWADQGKAVGIAIPEDVKGDLSLMREAMIDSLAVTDDVLLEQVLEGGNPPVSMLEQDLKRAMQQGLVIPILIGSAVSDAGAFGLLDALITLCPAPADRQYFDANCEPLALKSKDAVIAQVIKTYVNPQSGKLSIVRVINGTINADTMLVDSRRGGGKERHGGLYTLQGKKQEPSGSAGPGSIIAIARLETPHTGDTLVSEKVTTIIWAPPEPPPLFSLAVAPKNRNDEAKLSTLLAKLVDEDPLLRVDRDPDTNEFCLYGQGDVHLTINRQRLERKYHIELESHRPKIAYRESIAKAVEAHGRHKKQSGGRGQYGECYLRITPAERGEGNHFKESLVGGAIPRQYVPGIHKGVDEALSHGVLAGFPMVDVDVDVFDGSFHEVDSDEMSFRMAGILAIKDGMAKASPYILEPVAEVKIFVPSGSTPAVLSQLNGLRGHILSYGPLVDRSGWDEVQAHIPRQELWNYIIDLRTLTQGLGYYTWKFSHLAPVPVELSKQLQMAAAEGAQAANAH